MTTKSNKSNYAGEKFGLIGKTLVHSYSKEIHESLQKYTYDLFSLTEEEMPQFIEARDFRGLNVTIPYKKAVMPLCDEISPLASAIGAVNTLYWEDAASTSAPNPAGADTPENAAEASGSTKAEPGTSPAGSGISLKHSSGGRKLMGHNTDYEGFLYNAKRSGISFADKTVLILGTGGTSLMARKAAADQGAAKIYIASRSGGDGTPLQIAGSDVLCMQVSYDELNHAGNESENGTAANAKSDADCGRLSRSDIQIIVNTTPVGTFPNNLQSVISLADYPNCDSVIDVIYNPFKTALLLEAEKLGMKFANGLPMLVAQATAAAGYFLGTPGAFESENERIIAAMERQMRNIVLIGMPGCGKSTIGKLLAKHMDMPLVDMDEEIEKEAGMSIPEIFEKEGETGFRDRESAVARRLGKERGQIIATGGGAILRSENVDALRQNALVLHIKRPVDTLPTNGRPLSKNIDTLREMEQKRMPLYEAAADITFNNSRMRGKAKLLEAVLKRL